MVNMRRSLAALFVAALMPAGLLADFSYDETTKITGGAMARLMKMAGVFAKDANKPTQHTVALKGNRMAQIDEDQINLIDLDAETMTAIDFKKKTYAVITFAEMTEAIKTMQEKMAGGQVKTEDGKTVDVKFKVDVKETGEKKQISGLNTRQIVLTMEAEGTDQDTGAAGVMKMESDMWLADKIAGYDEVQDFYKRMAAKMAFTPGGMSMLPGAGAAASKGMLELQGEMSKLDGMPVLQVIRMDGSTATGFGGAGTPAMPSVGEALGGAISGRLGGFGRRRAKKQEAPKEAPEPKEADKTLIEMTTELSSFSSAPVDATRLEVPAGFKQVEHPMAEMKRKMK